MSECNLNEMEIDEALLADNTMSMDSAIKDNSVDLSQNCSMQTIKNISSEKRFVAENIDVDPPADNNGTQNNDKHNVNESNLTENYPIAPNGIDTPQKTSSEISQYIAELEQKLKMAFDNNQYLVEKLAIQDKNNQALDEKLAIQNKNNQELENKLRIETAERLVLEERLKREKDEKEKEIELRKKLQHDLEQQSKKTLQLEQKCNKLEETIQSKSEMFQVVIKMATDEYVALDNKKKKSEKELKDMIGENDQLKKMYDQSQADLTSANITSDILREHCKAKERNLERYEKERNADLEKLSARLYDLKALTATCIDRFRREPSLKHRRLNECIIAVNNRMSCYP